MAPGSTWINFRRVLNCYWYTLLEYLAVKSTLFYDVLLSWRGPVFEQEVLISDLSSDDKILHIGCSIFPTHTILLAKHTGAHVIGIDNVQKAIDIGTEYIQKIGMEDQITLELADGSTYPVKDFNVIFIAVNVWPIDTILKHIADQAKSGTKILTKSISNDVEELLETTGLQKDFEILKTQKNPKSSSYLLQKK